MKTMNSSTLVFGLGSLVLGFLIGFLYQQITLGSDIDDRDVIIATLQNELDQSVKDSLVPEPTLDSTISAQSPPSTTSSKKTDPIVVFEPGGLFSGGTKKELQKKLVDPFFDFYEDEGNKVVTMHVESPDQQPGPWGVFAIYEDESYLSFFFGNDEFETQDWWKPSCFESCAYSNDFKAKYPDIANN